MLHATGTVLGVQREVVTSPTGKFEPFEARTIHLRDGFKVDALRVGRDFPLVELNSIEDGDLLDVEVSTFNGRLYAERIVQRVPADQAKGQERKAS